MCVGIAWPSFALKHYQSTCPQAHRRVGHNEVSNAQKLAIPRMIMHTRGCRRRCDDHAFAFPLEASVVFLKLRTGMCFLRDLSLPPIPGNSCSTRRRRLTGKQGGRGCQSYRSHVRSRRKVQRFRLWAWKQSSLAMPDSFNSLCRRSGRLSTNGQGSLRTDACKSFVTQPVTSKKKHNMYVAWFTTSYASHNHECNFVAIQNWRMSCTKSC